MRQLVLNLVDDFYLYLFYYKGDVIKMKKYDVVKEIRKNWRNFLRTLNKIARRKDPHIVYFTNDMIRGYADCHKLFQAAVAIVSNYRLGVNVKSKDFSPRGIYKCEGGIRVLDNEIVIGRSSVDGSIYCYNDWDDKEKDTAVVVKEVVEEILSIQPKENFGSAIVEYVANNTNVPEGTLWIKINRFIDNPFIGDSLIRLFSPH